MDSKANLPEFRHKPATGISDSPKTIVGGTLGFLYEQVHDDKRRETLVMIRRDEYSQQLGASEAIIAASSKKKDVTTVVSQGIAIVKSPCQSDNDPIKVWAPGGLCKLGASGGLDAALRPSADDSSTKLAEARRRFLIHP